MTQSMAQEARAEEVTADVTEAIEDEAKADVVEAPAAVTQAQVIGPQGDRKDTTLEFLSKHGNGRDITSEESERVLKKVLSSTSSPDLGMC